MAKAKKTVRPALTFEDFVKRPPKLTILTDQPLTAEQVRKLFKSDPFNFRYKLGPVFDILRYGGKGAESDQMPTAILITGDWGTGKTTAMKWLEVLLEEWNSKRPDKVPAKEYIKVHPVWFYPWKYHDKEDVWKGLLAEVILNAMNSDADVKTIIEAFKTASLFVGKSVLALASATKIKLSKLEISGEALTKIKDEFKDAVYPENAYLNPYEKALEDWLKKTLSGNNRMVIFIDDLDRCMPEIGLQVLEALKLYLNIPNLVFVLGVDKKVVEKLVIEHYKKLGLVKEKDKDKEETEPEREDRIQAERKARQYLSKMFQTEIELAPSEKQINNFFEQHIKDIAQRDKRLADNDHQELFKRLILKFARRNPREVKRQLNNTLIAGAGPEMIDVGQGEQQPTFEQGLQLYFIREVLKGYTLIAEMINTDLGMRFFSDWSELAIRDKDKLSRPPIEPLEQPREDKSSLSDELIARESEYQQKKYTQLLSDQDLQALMQIPFSHKLAELMAEISPAGPAEKVVPSATEQILEIKEAPASEDYIIIRDAVARQRNKKPDELTYEDYRKTTKLHLSGSGITDISSLKRITNLQGLELGGTQVRDIGVLAGLTNLQGLNLSGTEVSDIGALAELTKLQGLYLSRTQVSDISVLSGLTNLQVLNLNGTPVGDISAVGGLKVLERLELSETRVSDINVLSGLTNLQELDLRATNVSDIGTLSGLTSLRSLTLSDTQIRDVEPLKGLKNLQELDLDGTQVANVGHLASLANLQRLYLATTPVSDVSPLASLTNVRKLNLDATQVSDVRPLVSLTNLQTLDLSGTQVSDIGALAGLTNLQTLWLDGMPVSDEQIAELKKSLPRLRISRG